MESWDFGWSALTRQAATVSSSILLWEEGKTQSSADLRQRAGGPHPWHWAFNTQLQNEFVYKIMKNLTRCRKKRIIHGLEEIPYSGRFTEFYLFTLSKSGLRRDIRVFKCKSGGESAIQALWIREMNVSRTRNQKPKQGEIWLKYLNSENMKPLQQATNGFCVPVPQNQANAFCQHSSNAHQFLATLSTD